MEDKVSNAPPQDSENIKIHSPSSQENEVTREAVEAALTQFTAMVNQSRNQWEAEVRAGGAPPLEEITTPPIKGLSVSTKPKSSLGVSHQGERDTEALPPQTATDVTSQPPASCPARRVGVRR